jgi:hypothetical protein
MPSQLFDGLRNGENERAIAFHGDDAHRADVTGDDVDLDQAHGDGVNHFRDGYAGDYRDHANPLTSRGRGQTSCLPQRRGSEGLLIVDSHFLSLSPRS